MKLFSINAGYFKLDGGAMFGVVPKSIWSKTNPADENNLCKLAMRSLLIEDEGKLILIDTGMGDKQDAKFFSHYTVPEEDDTLDGSLAILGYLKEDITDVVFTHLHFDHCGGAIIRKDGALIPAFPNATFWSNQIHWQWAINPNAREKASFLKENILPIEQSGKLKYVEVDNPEITNNLLASAPSSITKNISYRFANGHTKAMMLPQIQYKDRTIVFVADLLATVGHIPLPYVMSYDMFPLVTLEEKKSFFQEAVDNNYILFLQHDAVNECCTLQQTEKGIRVKEIFKLSDI
jgi:glyoxylase-like metal-dependent hydrolase (beta-lactamase superfamily II)